MNLSDLQNSKRIVHVGFQGHKIPVQYDVKGYGDPVFVAFAKVNKMAEENPERQRINNTIVKAMVTAWDLTEGCTEECEAHKNNGSGPFCSEHMLPVNDETLASVPQILCNMIATRVMTDCSAESDDPKANGTS